MNFRRDKATLLRQARTSWATETDQIGAVPG